MTVTCVIQARTGSTRLPGKVLADLAGRPLLGFMLERLARLPVENVVVATTELGRDDAVVGVAESAGVAVVRGSELDVLTRFVQAVECYPADRVVRLTADCPLTDPEVVMATLRLHEDHHADYTSNVHPRTFPRGLDVEVIATDALLAAAADAADPLEREHVTPFFYRNPERFRLANLRSGELLGNERWTVDTAEDLEAVRALVGRLEDPVSCGWRDVGRVAQRCPTPPSGAILLRPAIPEDGAVLFGWRNDPATIASSRTRAGVTPEEHARWFSVVLDDPATQLRIAVMDGVPMGMVRVHVAQGIGLVSVSVAPAKRARGFAGEILRALLLEVRDDLQVCELRAEVDPENVASLRAFERVGFRSAGHEGGFVTMEWKKPEASHSQLQGRREWGVSAWKPD